MNGLPYYKAYPRDFFEGTIGMDFEVKAAYRLVLDLIYMQNGRLPDDPRFISGHLGCSVRKWKSLREAMISAGKLTAFNGQISNFRADKELESARSFQDKQRENGRKPRKNNDIPKATAQPKGNHTEPDTDIRVPPPPVSTERPRARDPDADGGHGDGDCDGRSANSSSSQHSPPSTEPPPEPPTEPPKPKTHRERLLAAMGADPVSGLTGHGGTRLGSRADMELAARWLSELRIRPAEQLAIVAEVMARKKDGPPNSFAYFTGAMRRRAAERDSPRLTPLSASPGAGAAASKPPPPGAEPWRKGVIIPSEEMPSIVPPPHRRFAK